MTADLVPLGQGDGGDVTETFGDDYSAAGPPSPRRGPRNPEVDAIIEDAREQMAGLDLTDPEHRIKAIQINRRMETRIKIAKKAAHKRTQKAVTRGNG